LGFLVRAFPAAWNSIVDCAGFNSGGAYNLAFERNFSQHAKDMLLDWLNDDA
jgi:hypothetical protein